LGPIAGPPARTAAVSSAARWISTRTGSVRTDGAAAGCADLGADGFRVRPCGQRMYDC